MIIFFNYRLTQKMEETFSVEPNNLGIGILTSLYKKVTIYLKNLPFLVIIPLAFLLAVFIYLIVGHLVVKLTTLLQYGF